ncbi:MAG: hypothetical protein IID41_11115 [Planctomycetes bacterium]|nr:hypothetical protein [Planctomycetota bacterium]
MAPYPDSAAYNNTAFDSGFDRPGEVPVGNTFGFYISGDNFIGRNNCAFDNAFDFDWNPDSAARDFIIGSSVNMDSDYNLIKDGVGLEGHGPNTITVDPGHRSIPDDGYLVVDKAAARQLADDYADAAQGGTATWAMREQFISEFAEMLRPAPGSPLIDAGDFLVFATSAGANATVIPVDRDPRRVFRSGIPSIGVEPDIIQIDDGDGNPATRIRVRIASMTANNITVENPVSFDAGAGIHVPYTGNAPDIGAFEAD